jgi:hypothetical protein
MGEEAGVGSGRSVAVERIDLADAVELEGAADFQADVLVRTERLVETEDFLVVNA